MSATSGGGDNSLAFVDVITNGLGGMLVLFFIVLVIQANLEWSGGSDTTAAVRVSEFPFVVIARPADGAACFDADRDVWEFSGLPAGLIDPRRGKHLDWGVDYAIFLAPAPLRPTASTLSLRTNRPVTLDVEVYPAGARQRRYPVQIPANQTTEIWPRLGDVRP